MRQKPQDEYLTHVVMNRGKQPIPVPSDVEHNDCPTTRDPDWVGARERLAQVYDTCPSCGFRSHQPLFQRWFGLRISRPVFPEVCWLDDSHV